MPANKTEQPGRFEHYRVMTDAEGRPVKLGEGAMGVTYLAEDTNLRVKVALKVIAPSLLGDAEIVQRFQREAQAAARLRHPNVAAVYHLGTVDDTFFYTMEFVEGRTLREHVAENGPLTVMQALDVTLQMAEALGAAERHQMVHRDIKPANIMLETTEDGLHAKLIDFGLAKPLQHDAQQTSALLTQRGTFLGTAVFASPEQVQDLPLDSRSDFYALGLTMWVMLEGRPPFEGSLHKVLYDQVHTKPPLDRLLWVPAEVRDLLSRMLEKEPGTRPQTARELRQTIHDCKRAAATTSSSQADWQRRFQVRETSRAQPWGTVYEGQDSRSGEVWLQFLRSDRFGDTDTLNSVIATVRKTIEIHHPNVLRHITVFPASDPQGAAGWMVVTEHPGAHTLLAHLQHVKQLSAAEAFPLIERLAEALDCCLASDLHSAELDAARIYLKPQSAPDGQGPVEVVPKLIPVDYRSFTTLSADDETALGLTQIVPRSEARTAADAVQRLATLAYQCLGGSWGRMTRYIPLPGITQHQNETLRETLTSRKYTRAADFMDALRQTKMPRRTSATPPSIAEATVTLSPWERLAALAAPNATDETVVEPRPEVPPTDRREPEVEPEAGDEAAAAAALLEETPQEADAMNISSEVEAAPEPGVMPEEEVSQEEAGEAPSPPEEAVEAQYGEEVATEEAGVEATTASDTSTASAPSIPAEPAPVSTTGVRTSATELPLPGSPSQSAKSHPISALRQAVEREWRDAKPMIDRVATPVRDTVTTLPRWVFITFGCFAVVVAAALWMIANRAVSTMPGTDAEPGKSVAVATPGESMTESTTTPVAPPPPVAPSLDQLLESGTAAAARGDGAELLAVWNDMQRRFPSKWNSLSKSEGFITAVTTAWQENKLGDPTKASHDFLPVLAIAAKSHDVDLLKKLSMDLRDDAERAQPYEMALLNALVEDTGRSEMLLDESLRLAQSRTKEPVAERGRDLIRQTLEPIVADRERHPRPEDQTAALRNAYEALGPKLPALAALDEPSAIYLYADKLKQDGRPDEAMNMFEKAALLGHAPSMVKYGLLLADQKDRETMMPRAVHWLQKAEASGYAKAAFALGECYLDGSGVARDYDKALELLKKASDEDILEAHYLLGGTYLGMTRDPLPGATDEFDPAKLDPTVTGEMRLEKAVEYLEKAWKRQYPLAGMPLARALIMRNGGASDVKQAVDVLDALSRLPDPDPSAVRNLAWLFTDEAKPGLPTPAERRAAGVKTDAKRAEQLMRQAASAGDEEARAWCLRHGVKY